MFHPLHDSEIKSVTINHETTCIEIVCGLSERTDQRIVFRDVLSHLFLNTTMECIILDVEEIPLSSFRTHYAANIKMHHNYGWPFNFRFPSLSEDADELPENYKIWEISSSLGLFGCIIAKHAELL